MSEPVTFLSKKGKRIVADKDHYFTVFRFDSKQIISVCYHPKKDYWQYVWLSPRQFNMILPRLKYVLSYDQRDFYELL